MHPKNLLFILSALFLFFSFNHVYAQVGNTNTQDQQESQTNTTNPNTVYLNNPLPGVEPETLISNVINSIFGIVGSLALLMFIYGGLMWMTSGGSQEKVKTGREVIQWAAIGLIVIFLSYMMVRFVIVTIS